MNAPRWHDSIKPQVQRLALSGYDTDFARHLVLKVTGPGQARDFLANLLRDGDVTFGDRGREDVAGRCGINIGFTYRGLQALGVAPRVLAVLADKSPAFADGAVQRASRCLGDSGESAPDRWESVFDAGQAEVWIAIHGNTESSVVATLLRLKSSLGVAAFEGWDAEPPLAAEALLGEVDPATGKEISKVHFGFRDSISKPRITDTGEGQKREAGELLLGYVNNENFDLWTADPKPHEPMPVDIVDFLRNGSFGVLRKIEQHEDRLSLYLKQRVDALKDGGVSVSADYLKAKMCGRWPSGALIQPNDTEEPSGPEKWPTPTFDFSHDPDGLGCPFGAHIRRTNPRDDGIMPPRVRTLFRRGLPYGPLYEEQPTRKRGVMGVFFCASIEDQFERLISEWVEKNPMGPPNSGRSKDPFTGHHDQVESEFHIPQKDGKPIVMKDFTPFVTTRGTLYALFPGRKALEIIARASDRAPTFAARAAPPAPREGPRSGPPAAGLPATDAFGNEDAYAAPNDSFCDVVMEGGVTSGIIYASAVVTLARHYRFKGIGGSSIGAFAAGLTAAAEYQRRRGSSAGFEALAKLPAQLAHEDDSGRTRLERIFVPQPQGRRLFAIFLAMLNRSSAASQTAHGLKAALRQYRRLVVMVASILSLILLSGPLLAALFSFSSLQPAIGLVGLASWLGAALLTLGVAVFASIVAGVVRDVSRGLVPNGFGLCRGWSRDAAADSPDLAGFLHTSIQSVAGCKADDAPLTFKDLWDAPGGPSEVLHYQASGAAAHSINLEVYTSNLAHGRAYRFPLDEAEDMGRLFFRVDELEQYFPEPVLRYLRATSLPYAPKSDSDPPAGPDTEGYLELSVERLPIVVAVRLAMSFPLLISAVPLYAIDYEPPLPKDRRLGRCWMSDGGLCSNFPIHLFDSFVPKWPTFGISLQTRSELRPNERVWLPDVHTEGRGDSWDRELDRSEGALARLGSFILSLWKTTWHWNDSTMMRMPGVRDRVVRVFLKSGEGGVNIRMTGAQITALAEDYGKAAGEAFVAKFAQPESPGWLEHRWVRFNCLLIALRDRMINLRIAAEMTRHSVPLAQQISEAEFARPLRRSRAKVWPSEEPLEEHQVMELQSLLDALLRLEESFDHAGNTKPYEAVPRPSLRVRHPT